MALSSDFCIKTSESLVRDAPGRIMSVPNSANLFESLSIQLHNILRTITKRILRRQAVRETASSTRGSVATGPPFSKLGSIMPLPRQENLSGKGPIEPVPGGSANLREPLSILNFRISPMIVRSIGELSPKPAKVRFAGLLSLLFHGSPIPCASRGTRGFFFVSAGFFGECDGA